MLGSHICQLNTDMTVRDVYNQAVPYKCNGDELSDDTAEGYSRTIAPVQVIWCFLPMLGR